MAQDVQPIDAWGRYITSFDIHYKMVKGKTFTYVPKGNFQFVVKGAKSEDRILVQYMLNGKNFGDQLKCSIYSEKIGKTEYDWVSANGCMPDLDKFGTTRDGKWTVKVGYRQTLDGKDYPDLAEYKFETKPHKGASGGREFHIDQDFHMGESWIHIKGNGRDAELFTWFKVSKDRNTSVNSGTVKVHCSVNGKVLSMHDTTNARVHYEYDDYAKGGNAEKSRWQYNYFFPMGDASAFFRANPGNYVCKIMRNGEIDRELYFTIGSDGLPVKPSCQKGDKPLVSAPPSTTFIKTVFKNPQDARFDKNAFDTKGLHGRKNGLIKACEF